MTWHDLERIAGAAGLPLVVKGVLTAEDARLACEHGAAAIVVSNHGGRQLDGVAATIDVLPEVVEAVDGRVEVLVDGGIRRGTDVVKALALGARAVLAGRALLWGLAVDGEAGARDVLRILQAETLNCPAAHGLSVTGRRRTRSGGATTLTLVKRVVALALAAVAALGLAHDRTRADAAVCGLPPTGPLWVDYAGHDAPIVPKPGMVLAVSSGTVVPSQMRAAGAATIFFDLHLNDRIGTTGAPADPATIELKAKKLFDFAVQVSGCATPLIAENELFGAQTPTPWSATNAQYRANALVLLQDLAALGATPAITIANPPYTGGEAADWWREAAKVAILIRQVYFTSPGPKGLIALGPARASRSMRKGMRGSRRAFRRDRHSREPRRARAAVPVGPRAGREARPATDGRLARVRQAGGPRREAGRAGHEDRRRLVLGLAQFLGRRRRSRQAGRRVRLPLGARREAV